MMREIITRYGREGIGFAWLIVEPLAFCFGVLILWSVTKPAYEHGIRLAPFLMTGYMSLILIRHQIQYAVGALQANMGLLHHRAVAPLHIFISRSLLEIGGTTAAFLVVYLVLLATQQVGLPHDYLLVYSGWLLLAWVGTGFGLLLSGLAMRFDVLERIVPLLAYILIPLSGAFFMVSWLPVRFQETYLLIPFPHGIEMIRAGVFGEFVETRFHPFYAFCVGTVFNIAAMLLIASARDRIDVE